MDITENVYRFDCDNTIVGKFEDSILGIMNWRILKHTKSGNFIAPNNSMNEVFNNASFIGIKWEYANKKKTKIVYRFYLTSGNKITYIDHIAKDILYLQDNGDLQCYGYRFGKLAFKYTGVKI